MTKQNEALKLIYGKISSRGFYDKNDLIDIALLQWIRDTAEAAVGQAATPEANLTGRLTRKERDEVLVLASNCWDRDWFPEQEAQDGFIAWIDKRLCGAGLRAKLEAKVKEWRTNCSENKDAHKAENNLLGYEYHRGACEAYRRVEQLLGEGKETRP